MPVLGTLTVFGMHPRLFECGQERRERLEPLGTQIRVSQKEGSSLLGRQRRSSSILPRRQSLRLRCILVAMDSGPRPLQHPSHLSLQFSFFRSNSHEFSPVFEP